jgi:hypothetical protein
MASLPSPDRFLSWPSAPCQERRDDNVWSVVALVCRRDPSAAAGCEAASAARIHQVLLTRDGWTHSNRSSLEQCVRASSVTASDMLALSLLQARLIDLKLPIKIVEGE